MNNLSDSLLLAEILKRLDQLIETESAKLEVDKSILKELQDGADEGREIMSNGTLSVTDFTVIDTQISPGYPVKGYTIENTDKTNFIYVAHKSAGDPLTSQPQLDFDIIDVTKTTNPVFNQVAPNESLEFKYNRNRVKSIHLLAVTGSPTYKAWLTL